MIRFKHSGNAGDIIYSLSAIRQAVRNAGDKAELYLQLNMPADYPVRRFSHPMGRVMLNEYMYEMLRPLLLECDFISDVSVFEGQEVNYDLDMFRQIGFNLGAGNIARWYFYPFPELTCGLDEPIWQVKENDCNNEEEFIIINRTTRYKNRLIDYTLLNNYCIKKYFSGLPEEYNIMATKIEGLEYLELKDFSGLKKKMEGAKLFIGNQSMNFAIAEQIKIPRILEVHVHCPNVIPCGGKYFDVFTREAFEYALKQFLG